MVYQVLARKWRPKIFDDVIGQNHIVKTLKNSITQKKLAHAYLLSGTRGVGKTSMARIFAKAIRCENLTPDGNPCQECQNCKTFNDNSSLNYIEIDGASNNGVEAIRQVIDNVQYLPTSGQFKVYVIDEVHMLSTSAFNALLKTLEEPPEHVIFVFATTEPQKLLGTVLSRCQRMDFKVVGLEDLCAHVRMISNAEKIVFENPRVVKELCQQGNGSVRDTLSLLDQVLSITDDGKISLNQFYESLGLAKVQSLNGILEALLTYDVAQCRHWFGKITEENVDLKNFANQLLNKFFFIIENIDNPKTLMESEVSHTWLESISISELFWMYEVLVKDLSWCFDSVNPSQVFSIVLQKICLRNELLTGDQSKNKKNILNRESLNTSELVNELAPEEEIEIENPIEEVKKIEEIQTLEVESSSEPIVDPSIEKNWENFLDYLKVHASGLAANLEHGNPIEPISIGVNVTAHIGFNEQDKVFKEFLEEKVIKEKLINHSANFFSLDQSKIQLRFELIDIEEKSERNFLSKAEENDIEEEQAVKEDEEKLRNNEYIKNAQSLFDTKVDKIVLNRRNEE